MMENFENNIFILFKNDLKLVIDKSLSSDNEVVIRGDLKNAQDVQLFLDELKTSTHTEWISYNEAKNPSKFVYHKVWICQHSSRYKDKSKKIIRNANCLAKLDIKIKKVNRYTQKNDNFLCTDPPLPCVIKLGLQHTHETNTASSLGMLRVQEEVRMQFFQYFNLGMTPTECKHHHQQLYQDNTPEILADASKNPTLRQIIYLYDIWRDENLGLNDPLSKVIEKIPLYEDKGVTVKVVEVSPWAVLIVTPLMKRVHSLDRSQEVIFVDSTASVEVNQSTMTVMLAATKVGGLPIAAFVHENQTTLGYIAALELLKNNFPTCFGNKMHPDVFMTDDSAAEKNALKTIWPSAKQLLCHFHVAQAEWRWLHGKNSCVPLEEKKRLMKLFQYVMYASNSEELTSFCDEIHKESSAYPKFVKRFDDFFLRREEWLSLDRQHLMLRGNFTNNYSEAMMRVLKDIVLNRKKAPGVTALIEYCMTTWEDVLIARLLDFAYSRRKTKNKTLSALGKNMSKFSASDINFIGDGMFSVPSSSVQNLYYSVDTSLGTCTCMDGMGGKFCKHQCFVAVHMDVIMPNSPILSCSEKYSLAKVALGEQKCPPLSYFDTFTGTSLKQNPLYKCHIDNDCAVDSYPTAQCNPVSDNIQLKVEYATEAEKNKLKEKLSQLVCGNIPKQVVCNLTNSIDKALKSNQGIKTLHTISYTLQTKYNRLKKIKVQPTSIARRRFGVTRGNGRIPAGRPSKTKIKRIRNLSKNIEKNLPNAISHGSGH